MTRLPDRQLTAAFARARDELKAAGMGEDELALRLGVKQPTVNRWANGERSVPLEILPTVDELCGQPRGYVLRLAGLVTDGIDARTALTTDPDLDDVSREVVLHVYEYCRREAAGAGDSAHLLSGRVPWLDISGRLAELSDDEWKTLARLNPQERQPLLELWFEDLTEQGTPRPQRQGA